MMAQGAADQYRTSEGLRDTIERANFSTVSIVSENECLLRDKVHDSNIIDVDVESETSLHNNSIAEIAHGINADIPLQTLTPEVASALEEEVKRGNKRKRHNTRGSFEEILVKNASDRIVRHVSFSTPQNNNGDDNNDEANMDQEVEVYQVIRGAETLWRSAKKHATIQQKSKLRAEAIEKAVREGSTPLWTYGLAPLPDFMLPMPPVLLELQKKQAKAMADLAVRELRVRQAEDGNIADKQLDMVKDYYTRVNDSDFPKARDRLNDILIKYEEEEVKRLTAYQGREQKRYPQGDKALAAQLEARVGPNIMGDTTRSRSTSQGQRKRRRNNSPASRERGTEPTPGTSNAQANNRGRVVQRGNQRQSAQATRGRGRGRGAGNQGQRRGGSQPRQQQGYTQGDNQRQSGGQSRGQRGAQRGGNRQRGQQRGNSQGWNQYSRQERSLVSDLRDLLRIY
jgi:hypothetical protein